MVVEWTNSTLAAYLLRVASREMVDLSPCGIPPQGVYYIVVTPREMMEPKLMESDLASREIVDPFGDSVSFGVDPPSAPEKDDSERRSRESDDIASRYASALETKSQRSYSSDFVSRQNRSLMDRLHVTPEEEELVLYYFSSTASLSKTSSITGIHRDKVEAIVYSPSAKSRINDLRQEMQLSVLSKIEETQTVLLDSLQDDQRLSAAPLREIAEVFTDVSTVQLNLLSASRKLAGSTIDSVDPSALFTADELEYMAFLRKRLSLPQGAELPSGSEVDPLENFVSNGVDDSFGVDPANNSKFLPDPSGLPVDPFGDSISHPEGIDSFEPSAPSDPLMEIVPSPLKEAPTPISSDPSDQTLFPNPSESLPEGIDSSHEAVDDSLRSDSEVMDTPNDVTGGAQGFALERN
jgi:hypothetical protein